MTSYLYIRLHYNYVKRKKKGAKPPTATSKVIRITKPGKFFLVESAIQGFGFRNFVQGIRNPTKMGIRNPCPTDKEIRNPQLGIQNPRLSWVTLHEATSSLTNSSN